MSTEPTTTGAETASDDDGEPGSDLDPGGAAAAADRTVPAGALVVAIMVAAALGILAIVALTVGGSEDSEVDSARLAAGRFGERFLTFDHDGIADWKAGVLSLSTGGFAAEVEDVEEGLERLVTEAELDVTARVTEIFMGQIDDGQVSAVLLYDRDLVSASETRSESDRYMQVRLLHVEGEWLVDDVLDIATATGTDSGSPSAPAPGPAESTTTTGSAPEG